MAWQHIDTPAVTASPIASYLGMGARELAPHDAWELRRHDAAIRQDNSVGRSVKSLFQGWVATEIAEIDERCGKDSDAIRGLEYASDHFTAHIENAKFVSFADTIENNRNIALIGLRHAVLRQRARNEPFNAAPTSEYLGSLASTSLELAKHERVEEIQSRLRGLATEIIFASLVVDIPRHGLLLPAPAAPRLERPHSAVQTKRRRMNKARDYTLIDYDARLVEANRTPIQLKTAYKDEVAELYHDSITVICRASHMHVSTDKEAQALADTLTKPAADRPVSMQRTIEIAQANIMDEAGVIH